MLPPNSNPIFHSIIFIFLFINSSLSQQHYDKSTCTTGSGANYICNADKFPCDTFIVYRAQTNYNSLQSISSLFDISVTDLYQFNTNIDESDLSPGREIIIPVTCTCLNGFSHALFNYSLSNLKNSITDVACGVYEGLAKAQSLSEQIESIINVPIRCSCPDDNQKSNGVKFLSTYPVISKDNTELIARKFGISDELIWRVNGLQSFDTIFPLTTLLIPTMRIPNVKLVIENSPDIPREAIHVRKVNPGTALVKMELYVLLGIGILGIFSLISGIFICVNIRKKYNPRSFRHLSPISSKMSLGSSIFSPDFLEGVSKLKCSIKLFSLEELEMATENFNQSFVIGTAVYRGNINTSFVAIERMHSQEVARHVIDILTRINHLNVVKLEGCNYESTTTSYIVYEYAENGSLRDCLSNPKTAKQLTWKKRMQIVSDIAEALYYIHYCTKPAYVHLNINSRNVLITVNWRGKVTGFRLAKAVICNDKIDDMSWKEAVIVGRKEYLASEYVANGLASTKVDVYAFGIVLIELLSGKEDAHTSMLKYSVNPECSWERLDEKMKELIDPNLEGTYNLSDAVSLMVLGKACVEIEASKRPTMNDVLKTLSRMV